VANVLVCLLSKVFVAFLIPNLEVMSLQVLNQELGTQAELRIALRVTDAQDGLNLLPPLLDGLCEFILFGDVVLLDLLFHHHHVLVVQFSNTLLLLDATRNRKLLIKVLDTFFHLGNREKEQVEVSPDSRPNNVDLFPFILSW